MEKDKFSNLKATEDANIHFYQTVDTMKLLSRKDVFERCKCEICQYIVKLCQDELDKRFKK